MTATGKLGVGFLFLFFFHSFSFFGRSALNKNKNCAKQSRQTRNVIIERISFWQKLVVSTRIAK